MNTLLHSRVGQYLITDIIGRGSTSTVYKAYQASLKRNVAIKALHQHVHAQIRSRFAREAHAVAQLQHPNILPVYDFVQQDDTDYLVMQYVENAVTLGDLLTDVPMEPVAALRIMVHLLSALDYAHERGIIHRDVKPSNVLMPRPDWPLLADFGIAKIAGSQSLTPAGQAVGTAYYMAPEQGADQAIDARSDLYSAGVVLYEMVTGQVPFDAPSALAVLMKHMRERLPAPRSINPKLPESVEQLLVHSLEKDPAQRFQSAADMGQAVQAVIAELTQPQALRQSRRATVSLPADVSAQYVATPQPAAVPTQQHPALSVDPQAAPTASLDSPASNPPRDDPGRRTYVTMLALLLVLAAAGGFFLMDDFFKPQTPQADSSGATTATDAPEGLAEMPLGGIAATSPTAIPAISEVPATATVAATPTPGAGVPATSPEPASQSSAQTYVVQAGDTLSDIALQFGVTTEALLAVNNLTNPDLVQAGQILLIPASNVSPAAIATAVPTEEIGAATAADSSITVRFEDTDWQGGYRSAGGRTYGGRSATWIYGVGTQYNSMRVTRELADQPTGTALLRVEGMDSEGPAKTQIRIRVNATTIYEGPNPLPDDDQPLETGTWAGYDFPFEASLVQPGQNEIVIDNLSEGAVGRPPFFMLDYAEVIISAQ